MTHEPSAEPVIAPLSNGPLANYLILYVYPTGQVEFHCSNADPELNFKALAIMSDAMSNAFKRMRDAAEKMDKKPLIHVVNGG